MELLEGAALVLELLGTDCILGIGIRNFLSKLEEKHHRIHLP